MKLDFAEQAREDDLHWQPDAKSLGRLNALIKDCKRTPLSGTGKPEPLRGEPRGWWSRRITLEHRPVYRVEGESLIDRAMQISLLMTT